MTFETGPLMFSVGVANLQRRNDDFAKFVADSYSRFASGDWGSISELDKAINNDVALFRGLLFSVYEHPDHKEWAVRISREKINHGKRFQTIVRFLSNVSIS
jgi:hypothetical protein